MYTPVAFDTCGTMFGETRCQLEIFARMPVRSFSAPRYGAHGQLMITVSTGILHGITRDSVIQIARDFGHEVIEKNLIRTDLYLADEVFMVGTAAEVTPLASVDDHELGVGPVTMELQQAYLATVRGKIESRHHWFDFLPARDRAEA